MWSSTKQVVNNEIIRRAIRKTVFIPLDPAGVSQSTYDISNIPFIPDEMIVRTITSLNVTGSADTVFSIISDLTDWYIMASISTISGSTVIYNAKFPINREIKGTYTFKFLDYQNQPTTLNMWLTIQLEFIKY